jgi:hypothetical protein
MTSRFALPALLALGLIAAACASPVSSPSASPVPSTGAIAHPTGASEIVLRYDVAGGLVPASFFAAHVPQFTLYGDGTIVWVSGVAMGSGSGTGPSTGQPVRTGRFSEAQVQALLVFALGEGGLGIARATYEQGGIADAPTATFTINADGRSKTVSVYALGIGGLAGPDDAIRARFLKLAARLGEVDGNGAAGAAYDAPAYRGVLEEASGVQGVAVHPWPWPSIKPADFVDPSDQGVFQRRQKRLTPDEAAALGVTGYRNGISGGLYLKGPDGLTYSLALRPLLPDELG